MLRARCVVLAVFCSATALAGTTSDQKINYKMSDLRQALHQEVQGTSPSAKAKKESEESDDPSKINSQALNNVMMQMQLENAEKELREMLVYETPGLGAIWSRFSDERERLTNLLIEKRQREEKRLEQERIKSAQRSKRRKEKLLHIWDNTFWIAISLAIVFMYGACMYLIVLDRIEQFPELGTCFIPRGSPGFEWYSSLRWVDCGN